MTTPRERDPNNMTDNDYDFNEDDLKPSQGGGDTPVPKGQFEFIIEKPSVATDSNGKKYLKLALRIPKGRPNGNRVVFENYLELAKGATGKLNPKTSSFFRAIGLKPGQRPPGAPGGPDVSVLDGVPVQNTIDHQYSTPEEDAKGYPIRVQEWEAKSAKAKNHELAKRFFADKDAVAKAKVEAVTSWYEMSDDYEGLPDGSAPADDEQWG